MKKQIIASFVLVSVLLTGVNTFAATYDKNIVDVTKGAEIRGITTSRDAAGYAKASYTEEDGYVLHSKSYYLSTPLNDDFYEGWVVRKSPFAFISTGKLLQAELVGGHYENNFNSSIDYTDYDFYVVTLEPNDGNDAPADHIIEGKVVIGESVSKNITSEDFEKYDEEISPYQIALRSTVKKRIDTIGSENLNTQKILDRIEVLRSEILNRGYSSEKIKLYEEVLDAVEYVLTNID